MKKSSLLSRREFVGVLAATAAWPILGRGSTSQTVAQPARAAPQARTLEQERHEARENMEKALKPIREFSLPVETEPAFIFRARR